jgi:LacI family transcriptional regulator
MVFSKFSGIFIGIGIENIPEICIILPKNKTVIMSNINLKWLAKELNISISTVSRALRDEWDVSAETIAKVKELAQKHNYSPNPYAGSLRRQSSQTIAVVIPEIANNFFILAIDGIETVAREKGYHVLIYITHDDYEREKSIVHHFQNGRIDGIIMSVSSATKDYTHLSDLHEKGTPIVFFDRVCHEIETTKITTDDFASSFKATEHLIKNNCKRIAFLSLTQHLSIETKRKAGYLEALTKHDIPIDDNWVIECSNDDAISTERIKNLLSSPNRPDGIFASVEKLALQTYHICHDLNIRIPKNLQVLSFANLRTAPLLNPPLTTITQPAFDIGKKAAETLFSHLKKKQHAIPNENIVLKSILYIRHSTVKL